MPELKRIHRSVMDPDNNTDDGEDAIPMQPLDIDEQEDLIQQLEKGNSKRNHLYVNVLTGIYAICGLSFLCQTRKSLGKEFWVYGLGCISMALSIVSVRYEIVTDFQVFMTSQVQMNNIALQRFNVAVLVLVEWLALTELPLGMVSQIPLFLFFVSILTKRWVRSMENEITSLRGLKYKYKSA
ncbi:hypothetical protein ZYGR_0AD02290 [Zygosaccharomyces rouxii]|uniref:ZYRO0G11286p n=2 Tax=Zygosaccharomyces rouxii TaxID=4956 RepID=C5E0B3_ZYGRC|nr:uncharacterized protein ZYRO0G11286g [Zygosaccharomyces rouxii]KAH9202541.1 hypothetical protein LQ764DRAFT_222677 [Zygosaccharomyces rouxii]GAV51046.1 hypothetical protein ZYGR_0AD02290 [Zygosaccharomyces rouxii]CAR29547.1 ZYRO0G11286p [Zygosaccharomyces rouxii]